MGERSGQVGDLERVGDRLHLGQAGTKDSIVTHDSCCSNHMAGKSFNRRRCVQAEPV